MSQRTIKNFLAIVSIALGMSATQAWAAPNVSRPSYFLSFDYGDKVINLTPQNYNSVSDTLVYGDYASGFRVTKFSVISAGYGGKIIWFYSNVTGLSPSTWSVVGLTPFAGSGVASVKFAANMKDAQAMEAGSPPLSADELKSWSNGDYSYNDTFGGIIFFAQIGIGGVYGPGIGPVYVARGNFDVYVEKVDADHAFVRLTHTKLQDLSLQAGDAFVTVSLETYKKVADSMSYMIKTSDPEGAKAYNDLVRGNVAAIQMLSTHPATSDIVKKWDKYTGQEIGHMTNLYLGIPIIAYWTWTAGKIYELYDTQLLYNGTRSIVNYGIYLKERRFKLFNNHTQRSQVFYGATVDNKTMDDQPISKGYFGQYSWIADNTNSSQKNLQKVLADLVKKTGLQELTVNVPAAKDLDYVKVEFRATFDEAATLKLIKSSQEHSLDRTAEIAVNRALNYFATDADTSDLCANDEDQDACQERTVTETRDAVQDMYKALAALDKAIKSDDTKGFVQAYAELGKAVLKNSFVFKTCLDMAGEGVTMDYSILGTVNSAYQVRYTTTATPGVFTKTYGQPEDHVILKLAQ